MDERAEEPEAVDAAPRDRPWPSPSGPWVIEQRWEHLLFAHWRVPVETVRAHVPAALALDVRDGAAWLAVTPFHLSRQRVRGLPPIPGVSEFPELNVRTYVTVMDKPGVYFFSLDAGNPLAALFARQFFHLPYFAAEMSCVREGAKVSFRSRRGDPGASPEFLADYGPIPEAEEFRAGDGSLERWLTARYALYAVDDGAVYRAEVDHAAWPLRRARAEIFRSTVVEASGLELPSDAPLLHFSRGVDVHVWAPERIAVRSAKS